MSVGNFTQRKGYAPALAAMQEQSAAAPGVDRYAVVLAEARRRIQGQFTPSQIEDPGADEMRQAEALVLPLAETALLQARNAGERLTVTPEEWTQEILDTIFGYGVLAPYFADEAVEEIICNGPGHIYIIHAQRGKELSGVQFRTAQELRNFVNRAGGKELNPANPKMDAQIKDGSRLHAVQAPLAHNVPIAVTIRKHRLIARTLADLERLGTITPLAREFLQLVIQARLNCVIAGGTASGKTNFLNALANEADPHDRFIVVEDTPEVDIAKDDVIQLTTRDQAEAARAFSLADLIIEALRMRPDRIITGEARGPEIVDVLSAANTGHDGQMLTIHANSTRDVIQRMETMYLMKGIEVPVAAIRRQIADAFQVVVYLKRVMLGNTQRRFVTDIAEIAPSQFMEADKVVVQSIFEDKGHGLAPTGYFPHHLADICKQRGVPLAHNFFRR